MGARKRNSSEKLKEAKKSMAIAKLNNCPTSPRKMRLVADLVRGEDVYNALNILKFSPDEENPSFIFRKLNSTSLIVLYKKEVLNIYNNFHRANKHKMEPIPQRICLVQHHVNYIFGLQRLNFLRNFSISSIFRLRFLHFWNKRT